ncbi:MAG: AraC family transcriptional regulator [Treponema sp.]|jgi:AraC-like DNA-binding protein|nr:AraC family transcriptional regulator [Treponema sp.]
MEPNFKFYYKNEFRPLASLSLHEVAGFECPGGYTLPLDRPDAYALYFVMYGKGIYTLAGREFHAGENDIFALYPDMETKCVADKKDPWVLRAVSFNGADARLLLNAARFDPKSPLRNLEEGVADQVIQMIAGIYTYRGQDIHGTTQSTAMLYALMSLLVKTASWDQSAMPPGWTGAIHFQKALTFISENFSSPITVNDIANHVNLSRSRLYRIFQQQIFISPQQYLTEYRIREARNMLEKRKGSIKEIAHAVGIEDPYYFSTLFKQICGKSPSSYMKYIAQIEDKMEEEE